MSVFLGALLGCLTAFGIISLLFIVCMVVAVFEYRRRQAKKMEKMQEQVNKMFDTGGVQE